MAAPKQQKYTKSELEFSDRLHSREQWHKTIRLVVICVTILTALKLIFDCVASLIAQEKTWIDVALALVGTIGIFAGGAAAVGFPITARIRFETKRWAARNSRLEARIDSNRESSGLVEEGIDPPSLT